MSYFQDITFSLTKEFKEEWLSALRSGKYLKTKGNLYRAETSSEDPNGFCCIGVAAHLKGISKEDMVECGHIRQNKYPDRETLVYRKAIALGFPASLIRGEKGEDVASILAGINDGCNTFDQVIAYIERNAITE